MKIKTLPEHRRATYYFLKNAGGDCKNHITTLIDMEKVISHRKACLEKYNVKISYITYIAWAVSRVLIKYPEANAAFHDTLFLPKIAYYDTVAIKIPLDKNSSGNRFVTALCMQETEKKSLAEMQKIINYYDDTPFDEIKEYSFLKKFQRYPVIIGKILYRLINKNYKLRQLMQGSCTITSAGIKNLLHAIPIFQSTLALVVGSIKKIPIIIDEKTEIRNKMHATFSFDHRVIDGGIANEILSDVIETLESLDIDVE